MRFGKRPKLSMWFQILISPFKAWKLAEGCQLKQNCKSRMINNHIILVSWGCLGHFKTYGHFEQINIIFDISLDLFIVPPPYQCMVAFCLTKVCFKTPQRKTSKRKPFHSTLMKTQNSDNCGFHPMVPHCFIESYMEFLRKENMRSLKVRRTAEHIAGLKPIQIATSMVLAWMLRAKKSQFGFLQYCCCDSVIGSHVCCFHINNAPSSLFSEVVVGRSSGTRRLQTPLCILNWHMQAQSTKFQIIPYPSPRYR